MEKLLLVLRGCPGSGKSTWVKERGLEHFKLCPDDIRLMCSEPLYVPNEDRFTISQKHNSYVWKVVMQLLEYRMRYGFTTVIDATHSHLSDLKKYSALAKKYDYKMIVVDFTDVPLGECLKRNKQRDSIKWVPEESIRTIFRRFNSQKNQIPESFEIINHNDWDLDNFI